MHSLTVLNWFTVNLERTSVLTNKIPVEVAFANPDRQLVIELDVAEGTTALEAVSQSGICESFPEINLATDPMGIFACLLDGKDYPLANEYVLQKMDRVEIYRPLQIDPKQARAARAKKNVKQSEKTKAKK
jgi:putative ubiquitin-RnfH superfamily antitoxin RatB of RatAB toxin-antitoxin module